ncbi:MAG: hypothetical protein P8X74_10325 [Reinekea sp.]
MRKSLIPLCFPKNWGEPMGAPAIFEKQIEIKLLHSASTLESRIQYPDIRWIFGLETRAKNMILIGRLSNHEYSVTL